MRLIDAIPSLNGGSLVTAQLGPGEGSARVCYTVAEPGEHWVSNSLGVIAAVRAAGGDLGAAGLALGEMGGLKGRGARHNVNVPGGTALLIDESYNANPASMRATLKALGQTPALRRVAVLGSMKELGDFAPDFHRQLVEPLTKEGIDHAILVGEQIHLALSQHSTNATRLLKQSMLWMHLASRTETPYWSRAPTRLGLADLSHITRNRTSKRRP